MDVKCSREQGEDAEWQHLGIDCDIVLTFLMDVCNKVTCKWSTRGDMTLYLEKDKTVSEYWAIIAVCKPWINSVSGCIIGYSIPTLVHSSKPGTLRPVANLSECRDCARPGLTLEPGLFLWAAFHHVWDWRSDSSPFVVRGWLVLPSFAKCLTATQI